MRTAESILTRQAVLHGLTTTDQGAVEDLLQRAYSAKLAGIGRKVHFRGIIEFSNICAKNCFYCGIRKENEHAARFQMTTEEILECAQWALEAGYGSVVLQAGERTDAAFVRFVGDAIRAIQQLEGGALGITLSLGEQSEKTYRRWFDAGAHRYLLRIETSNPALYAQLHPGDHSWEARRSCLADLRSIGYQVGTGVMIGLPGQTAEDLAGDLDFFRELDVDMIGMGPYVMHAETPLAARTPGYDPKRQLDLSLRMIALTRLSMPDINIAATTALQALHPEGREMGLKAGANIIMPNLTPTRYRSLYTLYDGKPCLDENASLCRDCLAGRIAAIGEEIGYNERGDAPHFFQRTTEATHARPD
jgi:biotin synthase